MCTVTYLPLSNAGFLLTSSRDEKTTRPSAAFPVIDQSGNQTICFPRDPQSAGTWVASSSRLTVCLLNGAFRAHTPRAPYRHSRGLVVLAVFDYPSPADWLSTYNFTDIEPFTLIIVQAGFDTWGRNRIGSDQIEQLLEVRWDGQIPHVRQLNPQIPQIWSSATLYSNEVIARRQSWFNNWLKQQPASGFTVTAIRDFHKRAGAGDDINAVQMNRGNGMQTVSLTTVQHEGAKASMHYEDLLTHTMLHQQLSTTHEYVSAY